MFGNQLDVKLKPSVEGAKVYYTIDGYNPRETDMEYTIPMTYNVPADQYRELKTIVITPSGKRSQITRAIMYNKTPLPAVNGQNTNKGLKYKLYTGVFNSVSELNTAAVIDSGVTVSFNTSEFKKNIKGYGVIYTG